MESRRTQREEQICESVLRLWEKQGDLHTITVQQIADAAGLGKGTVYEYFTSREEIFAKAFAYRMEHEFSRLETLLKEAENFEKRLRVLLKAADHLLETQNVGMQVLSACLGRKTDLKKLCAQVDCPYSERVMALLELTIQRGVEEGVFPPPRSLRYAVLAMLSGLTGYVSYRRVHPQEPGLEQDTIELISRALA